MVLCACACSVTSIVSDCVTPWTVALQPPLSMGFSRQEFWSGFHVLLQGIFLTQRSNLHLPSPALQVNSLQLSHRGSPEMALYNLLNVYVCVCVCVCVCCSLLSTFLTYLTAFLGVSLFAWTESRPVFLGH